MYTNMQDNSIMLILRDTNTQHNNNNNLNPELVI